MLRIAPDGAQVEIETPSQLGPLDWHGLTRLSGGRLQRDFNFAPAGQYKVLETKIMPGATRRVFHRRGHDVILFEAADRSDSALVWVGPYHEATTFFGSAAPRPDLIGNLMRMVRFVDGPAGASVTSTAPTMTQQYGTMLTGWSDRAIVTVRPAEEAAAALPEWSGLRRDGREIWRSQLNLEAGDGRELPAEPYRYRYLIAGDRSVTEVVLRPPAGAAADPPAGARATVAPESLVEAVVDGVRASWSR